MVRLFFELIIKEQNLAQLNNIFHMYIRDYFQQIAYMNVQYTSHLLSNRNKVTNKITICLFNGIKLRGKTELYDTMSIIITFLIVSNYGFGGLLYHQNISFKISNWV